MKTLISYLTLLTLITSPLTAKTPTYKKIDKEESSETRFQKNSASMLAWGVGLAAVITTVACLVGSSPKKSTPASTPSPTPTPTPTPTPSS